VLLLPSVISAEDRNGVEVGVEALRNDILFSHPSLHDIVLFSPDDHLADLFLPLHREKKISALMVVVPSENSLTGENLAAWRSYISTLSPGSDNLFLLREGTLDGFLVRVVSVKDWKGKPGNGPVILDLAFLLAMYQNEIRTPFVDLPRKFLSTLDDRKVDISRIRPWVVRRDLIPLAYGYLPKLIGEMVQTPSAFRKDLPRKWRELRRAEYLAFFSANEEAIPHFEKYRKEEPEDPSILFKLAQMHFVDREIERGMRYLHRAFKADAYYIRGYSESALNFFRKGEFENAERVLRAGLLSDPQNPDLKQGLGRILLEQAKKLLPENLSAAEERFSEAASVGLTNDFITQLKDEWERAKEAPPKSRPPPRGMPAGHPKF
jgi:hypothetical protein